MLALAGPGLIESIIDWLRLEETLRIMELQPLPWAGCPPPVQAALQPSLEGRHLLPSGPALAGSMVWLWLFLCSLHVPLSCQASTNAAVCSTSNSCLSKQKCDKEGYFHPAIMICVSATCPMLCGCCYSYRWNVFYPDPIN